MRPGLLALLLLTASLTGCIGDGADVDPASTANTTDLNPWQAGLDDEYPTPDVAENRSADERRANVAEPGHPEFADFDAAMESWMAEHNITAGQLAIMKDGQLRYERGYGHVDRDQAEAANASTMLRIASVTKPMTKALVHLQVEQGLYNWTDPVFCLGDDPAPNCRLPLQPHPDRPVQDERIEDITVGHLVNHTAGWGDEPIWMELSPGPIEIAEAFNLSSPPPSWRVGQFLMGTPLEDAPGERFDYCNMCYLLAGLVAEAATGADLGALYDAYLFEPLDVADDIEVGYTLPEDRNPREPFYPCESLYGTQRTPNVYRPNETACWPDGGLVMEDISLPLGGLVGTAEAVTTVYGAYATDVLPSVSCGGSTCTGHGGSFPGTKSQAGVIVGDGWTAQFAYAFNSRELGEHCGPVEEAAGPLAAEGAGCTWASLSRRLFVQTGAWADADEAKPSAGADVAGGGEGLGCPCPPGILGPWEPGSSAAGAGDALEDPG